MKVGRVSNAMQVGPDWPCMYPKLLFDYKTHIDISNNCQILEHHF